MSQDFIDAVKDAFGKGALKLKTQIRLWCDHRFPDGRDASKGCIGFQYCDICGKTLR